jgi:release factor glutamine methyltransferase
MRLREWLDRGEAQLSLGLHPERGRRDAETLLLHLIGKNKAWLMAHAEDEFAGCAAIGYAGLLERRRRGEPIQYITGEAEFYGLPFRVDNNVLIPRPETEHLVEKVLELATHFNRPRIVDVGTGSGAIAIALACNLPTAQITATDLSASALHVARENAERNRVPDRIRFLQGDLLGSVTGEQFEFVVSNPPYVAGNDRNILSVEVRDYEPSTALFAGPDGLDIYRRLIPAARELIVSGGYMVLEIGYSQDSAVAGLLADSCFGEIEFTPDLQGIPRVAVARKPLQ